MDHNWFMDLMNGDDSSSGPEPATKPSQPSRLPLQGQENKDAFFKKSQFFSALANKPQIQNSAKKTELETEEVCETE